MTSYSENRWGKSTWDRYNLIYKFSGDLLITQRVRDFSDKRKKLSSTQLDVSDIPPGCHFITVRNEERLRGIMKLIKYQILK